MSYYYAHCKLAVLELGRIFTGVSAVMIALLDRSEATMIIMRNKKDAKNLCFECVRHRGIVNGRNGGTGCKNEQALSLLSLPASALFPPHKMCLISVTIDGLIGDYTRLAFRKLSRL